MCVIYLHPAISQPSRIMQVEAQTKRAAVAANGGKVVLLKQRLHLISRTPKGTI